MTSIKLKYDNMLQRIRQEGKLLVIMLTMILFASCQNEDEFVIPMSDTPELTASKTTVELDQKQANNPAINLSWTRGSNRGTDAAIDYVLQFAESSDHFDNAYEMNLGRVVYSYQFQTGNLNDLLLEQFEFTPDQSRSLAVRVKTIVADSTVTPEYSNVVDLSVTPYEPVTETLYMIGDATPNGWDAGQATEMTADEAAPGVFTYSGSLNAGELKFITTSGQFLPSYNKGESANSLVYRTEDSQPDEKFVIDQTGVYTINVNLLDLTISLEKLDQPPFSNIYIVGDASPSGWNIDTPEAFTQSESDPFIFTYEGLLTPGSFKILAGNTGDWCGEWYRPLEDGEDITETTVDQNSGCEGDTKWAVTEANQGYYKITLNTRDETINISPVNLYIIGDAGPNGWNINDPAPMEKNGAVYTYTGPLTAGEFKISKFTGDWCDGEWINAATASQPISNTDYITTQGCDGPDNKWVVDNTTAGDYTVTIDLANGTMTIE